MCSLYEHKAMLWLSIKQNMQSIIFYSILVILCTLYSEVCNSVVLIVSCFPEQGFLNSFVGKVQ